ncbi:MAG: APC family permease [Candidatus Eremiobacterota bacterium]
MNLNRELGLRDLILFNIAAIVGLRWISNAAAGGISSITLWLLAALLFFIPQGLTVMELSRIYPSEGGIYQWVKHGFGEFHGFICGWCYWTSNLIYYPTLLIYMAGSSVYIFGDSTLYLEKNRCYNLIFCLIILWIAIILNTVGMKTGKWVQNLGAIATWMPIVVLICAGSFVTWKFGFANPFSFKEFIPDFRNIKMIAFFSTLCFGFAGLELASVMGDEIKEPAKNLPRAIVISGIMIAFIYIAGTLSLLAALPGKEISVITGLLQAIKSVELKTGFPIITSIIAIFIVLGGVGGTGAWLSGSARIPFVAGIDNFLPSSFGKIHPAWHTPYVAILFQGAISSIFIIMAIAGSTVKEAYTLLVDMTVIVTFIPYVYMFISLLIIKKKEKFAGRLIPGGIAGICIVSITGLFITLLSMFFSSIPPEGTKNSLLYEGKLLGGSVLFILIAMFFYFKGKTEKNKNKHLYVARSDFIE